jgi:hypothetical protein
MIEVEVAVQVVAGLLLLFAGRRLVWLAVAALGFGLGVHLVALLGPRFDVQPWIVAAVAGLVGAVLALVVQRVAVTVGFGLLGAVLAGWFASGWLASAGEPHYLLLAVVVGALVGAVLARSLFAVAVAILTASAGSLLLANLLPLGPAERGLLAAVAAVVGVAVQLRPRPKVKAAPPPASSR